MSYFRALIFSLIIHLLILSFFEFAPESWLEKRAPEIAEIVILPQEPETPQQQKQIVREAPAKEQEHTNENDPARFMSANKQRVLIETRAKETGITQNRTGPQKNSWLRQAQKKAEQTQVKNDTEKSFDGYKPIQLPRVNEISGNGVSTIGEALPTDVSIGSFTALNTDRYTFYSFYARVEDLVRFRWESRVHHAIDTFDRNYILSVIGNHNWLSKIEFVLDKTGKLVQAKILKSCGISKFDMAAVNSFQEAGIFPNPPQEMVESDGYIHLQYSFTVRFNPSALVNN